MPDTFEISPRDLKQRLDCGEKIFLVDVRQDWEHQLCRIEGSTLVPLQTIESSLGLFEGANDVVVYCHHGVRSLNAVVWLRQQGVPARSMSGGIARWAEEVDPSLPKY